MYYVNVTRISEDYSNFSDAAIKPEGRWPIPTNLTSEEAVLDFFHSVVPIKCLEDYEIEVRKYREDSSEEEDTPEYNDIWS